MKKKKFYSNVFVLINEILISSVDIGNLLVLVQIQSVVKLVER